MKWNIPILLCFLVVIINLSGQSGLGCEESSCGNDGPSIRFPFRIKKTHCGYPNPGFDLSCTENNQTLLELPNRVKVYVKSIDYVNQIINISHPYNCFQSQAKDISSLYADDGGGSPFQFYKQFPFDFTLFNCSSVPDTPTPPDPVACLSHPPHYQVYAVDNLQRLSDNTWLVSCTKMYNALSVPYDIFSLEQTNNLQLTWSQPACGNCEAKGGTCQFNTCAYLPHTTKGISIKLIITGVTSFILVLVLAGAAFVIHTSQREKEKQARIEKFLQDYEALTLTRYSYSDLKRITNQFKVKLGQGAYGEVFKGKISNEILVAVKILKNSIGNGDEFINEVGTLGTIHHVNVVRLVGFCAEGYHRAFVYEFLPNESLDKFIFSNDRNSLTWKKLQHIALGIAKGIQYLHQGCDQRILHFDIKPHNILLDENFTPKIADFGLSKLCSKDQSVVSMTNARGTMGYIAPEVFSRNFGNVSCKSDIYSYGMLLLEMVGGRKSLYTNIEEQSNQAFFPEWVYDHLKRGEELQILNGGEEGDAQIVRKLTIVGLWCIQWFPVDRPSMTIVLQMLEGEGNDLEMPPNPFASNSLWNMGATNNRRMYPDLEIISEIE